MIRIAQQRDIDLPQSSIMPWHILPVPQRVLGVDAHKHNVAVPVLELVEAVLESEDFGRTHEAEGCGNEEQD